MYKMSDEYGRERFRVANGYFEGLNDVKTVFGSVYIFKVKDAMTPGDKKKLIYEDLDQNFIDTEFGERVMLERLRWIGMQEGLW